jgi:hypothetical protein
MCLAIPALFLGDHLVKSQLLAKLLSSCTTFELSGKNKQTHLRKVITQAINDIHEVRMIFFALCASEAAIFLALVSLYRAATKPDVWSFLLSNPGWIFLCSSIIIVFSIGWAIRTVRNCVPTNKKYVFVAIGMNLVMLVLTLGSTEIVARLLSKQTAAGETVLGVILYPKQWSQVAAYYKKVIDEIANAKNYVAYDRILGWTPAPFRSDRTGLYLSSSEGLRSPRVGMSFADLRTRHSKVSDQPASVRIALIGDSMTYGYEVRCEESWGHALEGLLQPRTQVLNFAVSAYGLNQALLRYEKDVRPWKPQIVVIGITSYMIRRDNSIYPFIKEPKWGFPFARPRLVMKDDVLTTINHPVPDPGQIFANTAISEVPYLDFDDYYRPLEWERGGVWHLLERSYIFRFTHSLRAPSNDPEQDRILQAMQLSQFVAQRLVREVVKDGAVPLVVYLPYKHELGISTAAQNALVPLSARMLRNAGIEYFDPTACLIGVKVSDAYMKEGHYSPQANTHIAHCLEPVLRGMIDEPKR